MILDPNDLEIREPTDEERAVMQSRYYAQQDTDRWWHYERILRYNDPDSVPTLVKLWGLDERAIPWLVNATRNRRDRHARRDTPGDQRADVPHRGWDGS